MSDTTTNGRVRRCPVCGRGILRPRLISEAFSYESDGECATVRTEDVPVEDCNACGESFSGPKAARIRHEAIGRAIGLLSPADIRAVRERLGQTPEEFARLVGVGVDRLSQWEEGTLWQNRTADRLIRLLATRPENADNLRSLTADRSADPGAKSHPRAQSTSSGATGEATGPQTRNGDQAKAEGRIGRFGHARRVRVLGEDA